ncbi:MAG: two-component regulator propeller domain-containing protein, partial [Flavobacteriaceae bacterium]
MVIRYIKSFTPLVGLVLFHLSSLCQQPHFKNYTVNEGLASSQVYDIIQDGKGYIWFATDRGLSRYNGYVFESYSIQDGLPNTSVLRFYQHDNGTIWCTTVGNKLFYIDHDGHFRPYKYNHIIQETVQDITISELVIYRESLYMGFINGTGYIKIDKVGNVANHTIGDKSIAILLEKKGNQQIGYKIPDTHEGTHIFDRGTQF